jgi:hypothetical protein
MPLCISPCNRFFARLRRFSIHTFVSSIEHACLRYGQAHNNVSHNILQIHYRSFFRCGHLSHILSFRLFSIRVSFRLFRIHFFVSGNRTRVKTPRCADPLAFCLSFRTFSLHCFVSAICHPFVRFGHLAFDLLFRGTAYRRVKRRSADPLPLHLSPHVFFSCSWHLLLWCSM